jgi:hypothetical protein
MSSFDPQGRYDVHQSNEGNCGEIVKGVYTWRNGDLVGRIVGNQLFNGDEPIARLEGLTLIRDDDGLVFELVAQEKD